MCGEKEVAEKKKRARWLKILLISLGIFFLALGFIGIFIPVLPTTPFVLLAAALFARNSEKFYQWLIKNRFFGQYVKDYREGKGVPLRVKMGAILLLWVTIGLSIVFGVEIFWVRILLIAVALGVTIHIAMIKRKE